MASLLTALTARAKLLHAIRTFFYQRDVMEVETPALSQAGNTDPAIESFQVPVQAICDSQTAVRYLHTSPEYPMKRLLSAGCGDIYQICKVWRAGESGQQHNPEFTLLEWYRVGFSYHQLMQEVELLLLDLLPQVLPATRYVCYQHLFLEVLGIDPHIVTTLELNHCINQHGLDVIGDLDHSAMLDLLMTHCIEPEFATDCLTFVYDYPAQQKALACLSNDAIPVAQRFEVYLGSLELGNGYQEQTDAEKNAAVLHEDRQARKLKGMLDIPPDELFLASLAPSSSGSASQGLPVCSGVALGLDRLLMCVLGVKKLEDVISFPWKMA